MADYTRTAANVKWVSGGTETLVASEAIAPGEAVYKDANGKAALCDNTNTAKDECIGIALGTASTDQHIVIAKPGAIVTYGAIGTVNVAVVTSVGGEISPIADITTGDFLCILGYWVTTSNLQLLNPIPFSGVASA